VIFVSHKLDELYAVCDRVTIMRDGERSPTADMASDRQARTRREHARGATSRRSPKARPPSARAASARSRAGRLASERRPQGSRRFDSACGAARSSALPACSGPAAPRPRAGVRRRPAAPGDPDRRPAGFRRASPIDAIAPASAFARRTARLEGIVPDMSVSENLTLALLPQLTSAGIVDEAKQRAVVEKFIKRLGIKCSGPDQKIRELSGGNQQKVLLARWLCHEPEAADPGRADARHRRRRQGRDPEPDQASWPTRGSAC
jgi:monosaccharide-transporting ATPase